MRRRRKPILIFYQKPLSRITEADSVIDKIIFVCNYHSNTEQEASSTINFHENQGARPGFPCRLRAESAVVDIPDRTGADKRAFDRRKAAKKERRSAFFQTVIFLFALNDRKAAHVRAQNLRHGNGAVRVLVVFQNGGGGAANGHAGAV